MKFNKLLNAILSGEKEPWWVPKHTPNLVEQLEICHVLEEYHDENVKISFKDYYAKKNPFKFEQYRKLDVSRYLKLITPAKSYDECHPTENYKIIKKATDANFSRINEFYFLTDSIIENLYLANDSQPYIKPFSILRNYLTNIDGNYLTRKEFFFVVCTTWTRNDYDNGLEIIDYIRKNEIDLDNVDLNEKLKNIRIHKYFEQHSKFTTKSDIFTFHLDAIQEEIDQIIEDELFQNEIQNTDYYYDSSDIQEANSRHPSKQMINNRLKYRTDKKLAKTALMKSDFKCEYALLSGESHPTFTNKLGWQYSEAHHIIPMSFQSEFENKNLDCLENIISLCPICHRQVHYGDSREREVILEVLFESRKELLKKRGFNLTFENLLNFYI